jgi:hypothetical protein
MTTIEHDDPLSGTERHRAVRRALVDARNLAQLQIDILARLDQADRAGDDETVLGCHAELDRVMALIAEAEQVRTGARASLAGADDLTCARCGEVAKPVYAQPRLMGYQCTGCDWSGDDPDALADRKRTEALHAAAAAIGPAAQAVAEAMTILGHRGKQARTEGIAALRDLEGTLITADQRLRRTQAA